MEKITDVKSLLKRIESDSEKFEKKLSGEGGKRVIAVCGGTGCLANGSDELIEEIEKQIAEHHLEKTVSVNTDVPVNDF